MVSTIASAQAIAIESPRRPVFVSCAQLGIQDATIIESAAKNFVIVIC
jgi:hypothetical protein